MAYGMLADDLTGAMDAGVRMLAAGMAIGVCFEPDRLAEVAPRLDLVVADTESRNLGADEAASRVSRAVAALGGCPAPLLYKKIDSTLRGNLGAEMDAVLAGGAVRMIVAAPALPYNGRVTLGGVVLVNGVPLADTEFASDPLSPLTDSRAAVLIERQSRHRAAVVGIEVVRGGGLADALSRLEAAGRRIAVVDAETDGDLAAVARAVFGRPGFLGCGSAGLFDRLRPLLAAGSERTGAPAALSGTAPVVALSGSPSRVSKAQLARAAADGHVVSLLLDARIPRPQALAAEVGRVAALAADAVAAGANVAIDAAGAGKAEILGAHGGDEAAVLEESARVQAALVSVLRRLLEGPRPGGLVLFGGDTALSVCRSLGAAGIRIVAEAEPFVPAGQVMGGPWDGLPLVTKAGGFGSESVVASALRLLRASANG